MVKDERAKVVGEGPIGAREGRNPAVDAGCCDHLCLRHLQRREDQNSERT